MKKIKTLKKNYEFKKVFLKGKFYKGKQISVYVLKNNKNFNVIGIAVSTKQCGAVARNRIKRLVRENYRMIKDNLEKSYDIIFLWNKNKDAKEADYYIIKKDIEKNLKRAGLMK